MDLSEELKRLYILIDRLDGFAADGAYVPSAAVKDVSNGIRGYVDSIASQVDYDTDDDEEEEEDA